MRGAEEDHLAPDSIGRALVSLKRIAVEVLDDAKQLPGTIDAKQTARTGVVDSAGTEVAPEAFQQRAVRLGEPDGEHEQQLPAGSTERKTPGTFRETRYVPGSSFFPRKLFKCIHTYIIQSVPRGTSVQKWVW